MRVLVIDLLIELDIRHLPRGIRNRSYWSASLVVECIQMEAK